MVGDADSLAVGTSFAATELCAQRPKALQGSAEDLENCLVLVSLPLLHSFLLHNKPQALNSLFRVFFHKTNCVVHLDREFCPEWST